VIGLAYDGRNETVSYRAANLLDRRRAAIALVATEINPFPLPDGLQGDVAIRTVGHSETLKFQARFSER
jgi:hypothetical protein